jgi:hypothetical protein
VRKGCVSAWRRVVATLTMTEPARFLMITSGYRAWRGWGESAARCAPRGLRVSARRHSSTVLWPGGRKFGDNQGRMCGMKVATQ